MSYTEIISISIAIIIAIVFVYFLTRKNNKKHKIKQNFSVASALSTFFNGDSEMALEKLKDIAIKGNASPEVYLILGFLFRKKGDYTRAAQIHEMLLVSYKLDSEFYNALIGELAEDYMLAGQYAKSVSLLQQENQVMNNPDNIVIMAKCNLYSQSYDKAIKYLTEYNKITGDFLYGFFEKCMVEKAVHSVNPQTAFKCIKSALEKNNKCRPARVIKGLIYMNTNKIQKAINEFKSIVEEGLLRDINDFQNVEKVYLMAGKESELTQLLKNQCLNGNINPFIHIALANQLEYNNEKEEAKVILESYLELPDAKMIVAQVYSEKFNNMLLSHIIKDTYFFKCNNCGYETNQYKDDCPKCSAYDSIYPK